MLNPSIFGSGYVQSHNFLKLRNSGTSLPNNIFLQIDFTPHLIFPYFFPSPLAFPIIAHEKSTKNRPRKLSPHPPLAQLPRKLAQRLRRVVTAVVPATPRRKRSCGASPRDFSGPGSPLGGSNWEEKTLAFF